MTVPSVRSSSDEDALITIATFPNPHEAELARAALRSQGLVAVVNNDHGQYATAASWVHLQVARHDQSMATLLLEQGPLDANEATHETDDMRPLRQRRRFILARWFLYAGGLPFLLTGVMLPLAAVAFGLALWSRQNPRTAFGAAAVLQIFVVFFSILMAGLWGLIALIPMFGFHFAWASAAAEPPERLVASPVPNLPRVVIGDSWRVAGARSEPTEPPTWILHVLGMYALGFAVVCALSVVLR